MRNRENAKSVATAIKNEFKSSSDNKGFSLLIADHSSDLLSVAKQLHSKDLLAFLRCLSILPSSHQSSLLPFSSSENDADLLLKEWLRTLTPKSAPTEGSFVSSVCHYLKDVQIPFELHD